MLFFRKKQPSFYSEKELEQAKTAILEKLDVNIKNKNSGSGKMYSSQVMYSSKVDDASEEIMLMKRPKSFGRVVYDYIQDKGYSEHQFYKKSGIGRKIFWNLMNISSYQPSKKTAVQCAFGLELDMEETEELLQKAGYALSDYIRWDVAIKYAIDNKIYDIMAVNEILNALGETDLLRTE